MEIRTDEEPHLAIGELLKGCSGRIADSGGRFKVLAGEPGEPVFSFTDEDIIVSEGQRFDPFPAFDSIHNAITATYPEPVEAWNNKEAPPRYSSTLEAEDAGQRLPFSTNFRAVPFANQVQRLMRAMIEEERRFRRHSFTGPPEWWELEPLDCVEWTSAHNGYEDKNFLLTVLEDLPNCNQVVGIHELEPGDYDWETGFELPFDTVIVTPLRPPAQAMTGWQVEPYIFVDAESNARRPGILVLFAGALDDVRAVRVQVRLAETAAVVFDGEIPYDLTVEAPSVTLQGTFLRDTDYEVRGIFLPYSGRLTDWSEWLAVTTPDVGIGEGDLDALIQALLQQLDVARDAALGPVLDELRERVEAAEHNSAGIAALLDQFIQNSLVTFFGNSNANITEVRTIADGLADLFLNIFAGDDVRSGNGLLRFTAAAAPEGVAVSFKIEVRATTENDFAFAGLYIDAGVTALGGASRIRLVADSVTIENASTGQIFNALMLALQNEPVEVTIDDGDLRVDLTNRQISHYSLIDDDGTIRLPTGIRPGLWWTHTLEMDGSGGHTVDFDTSFVLPPYPEVSNVAGDITVLRGDGVRTSQGTRAIMSAAGFGQLIPPEQNILTWIEEMGGLSDQQFALDAGSAASYDPGVAASTWRDLKGAQDFSFGSSPTFNGTPGNLSPSEYFSSDGDDHFQTTGWSGIVPWAQDNARCSFFALVYVPDVDMRPISTSGRKYIPLFGNAQRFSDDPVRYRGLGFNLHKRTLNGAQISAPVDRINLFVYNNANSAFGSIAKLISTVEFPSDRLNKWNFLGFSINESAGGGAGFIVLNKTVTAFDATYTSPWSGAAQTTAWIGRLDAVHMHMPDDVSLAAPKRRGYVAGFFGENGQMVNGQRFHCAMAASRPWATEEFATIYAKLRERGFTDLPE
jgi:hypothetical protein